MEKISQENLCSGKSTCFVPTMGFLHTGHISLIKKAAKKAEVVIVSIFVNPLQFTDTNDFEKYPQNLAQDINILEKENVDILFLPDANEIYPKKKVFIQITCPTLTQTLCGVKRPGHFEGVLYIVHNLLSWIKPDFAIFGLKDYQQYILIKTMTQELALPCKIISAPIVREDSGLALSSRNARLDTAGTARALGISKSLFYAKDQLRSHNKLTVKNIKEMVRETLSNYLTEVDRIEYIEVVNPNDLSPLPVDFEIQSALLAVAVFISEIRLIDNIILEL